MFDFFVNVEIYSKELERLNNLDIQINTEIGN